MEVIGILLLVLAALSLAWVVTNIQGWPRVRVLSELHPAGPPLMNDGAVSVCIPARDEEHNLPELLASLIAQGDEVLEILVLDDQSTDGTADVVRRFTALDRRVKLVRGRVRPEGWFGKTWAGHQLSQLARGGWVLYLDADVILHPDAVRSMLTAARRYQVTYLSCWPRFVQTTWADKVFLPLLNFVAFTTFSWPLMLKRMDDEKLIISSGACMLMERRAYDQVGGHAACAGGLLEDHALARAWRRAGERSLCLDGQDVVSVRMYRGLDEMRAGFTKNFYKALRGPKRFWTFVLFQSFVYLTPFVLAPLATLGQLPSWHCWTAAALVLVGRWLLARNFRQSAWAVWLHPLAMVAMLATALSSWFSIVTGRGVTWKGRSYFQARRPAAYSRTAKLRF
ncbi:glycosyltransferase [bacterium]|nr:glycosyltransferase [bacterium]